MLRSASGHPHAEHQVRRTLVQLGEPFAGKLHRGAPARNADDDCQAEQRHDGEHPCRVVAAGVIELSAGALATNGDARRFPLEDGERYGHIVDPRSGWPVRDAPGSVTVAAPTRTEAEMLATLAMLQGPGAEEWLAAQGMPHWVLR